MALVGVLSLIVVRISHLDECFFMLFFFTAPID